MGCTKLVQYWIATHFPWHWLLHQDVLHVPLCVGPYYIISGTEASVFASTASILMLLF